jgi:hypothetical protein
MMPDMAGPSFLQEPSGKRCLHIRHEISSWAALCNLTTRNLRNKNKQAVTLKLSETFI